jgi:hypothetical protein
MSPTTSPVTGALPMQPAPTAATCAPPPPPLAAAPTPSPTPTLPAPALQAPQAVVGASPATTTPPATTVGGGTIQAAQGAMAVSPEQLIPAIQGVIASITNLIAALQAGGVTGGGAPGPTPGQVGQCGMPGCTMNHAAAGAAALSPGQGTPAPAPTQGGANGGVTPSDADTRQSPNAPAAPRASDSAPSAALVDPSTVKDTSGTGGLTAASRRGLEEAHKYGLPLVSGKRSGNGKSDHDHGNATDVGTLPIGVASSDGGTPTMKAFAEHMRQQGKAGQLNVKYVIADGRIASATNNWEWREYTYPDKSKAELEALKRSNRGEYNRLQHFDHVHVSYS